MEREEILAKVPIFAELDQRNLKRLAKLMTPRSFKAGDVIIRENDQPAGFFVVSSGKVEAVTGLDGERPHVLAVLGPGEFFGEMALFENYPRSASVRALEDTDCLAMTRWDFTAELRRHAEIALGLIAVLARRLRETDARLSE